ncbi:hypothetical protein PP175_27960 (plasmid) [Aneurinibacillus sp. Ricciae_BoGa-3]|uniref:hypothetical protein n=1 Tax=Aneurinibacillus sp. Ricciae_BoGa-3 TaxID=3022697 RepID=UPI00234126DD|nr:hypothetical protein [Aneurinibacillus sp. Ricciae_BoGa-3]WCK57028.1 hypothetical protein PP175_27960 [Aneurinibacillus sp. Ricciae_BoGa-3]
MLGYVFNEGHIEVCREWNKQEKALYWEACPRNFLEIVDTLKKLSFLCDGVYVLFKDATMQIILFQREPLDLFTKLKLSSNEKHVEINERLKEYLLSIED